VFFLFYSLYILENARTPVGNQPMDEGDMKASNISTVGSTYKPFKT